MQQRPSNRSCGPCTACCKPFAVPEVGKSDSDWCSHCTLTKGCEIYEIRPFACSEYSCVWLAGKGDETDRPDILGVMMDVEDGTISTKTFGYFHFHEIVRGKLHQPRIDFLVKSILRQGFVVVIHEIMLNGRYWKSLRIPGDSFTTEEAREIKEQVTRGRT
jgi:hypothetical protein